MNSPKSPKPGNSGDQKDRGVMYTIARNGGAFFFFSYVAAVLASGLVTYLEGAGYRDAITPVVFYSFAVIGAPLFLASFFIGARDRQGGRPTFGTLALFWLGLSILIIVSTAGYIRLELSAPVILPMLPEWLVFGVRNAAFVLVFEVGWGIFFGMQRGFIAEEASPFPLGFLFKRSTRGVEIKEPPEGE